MKSSTRRRPKPTAIVDPAKAAEREALWRDISSEDHGGRALGADLQRGALHHPLRAYRRRRQAVSSIPVHIPVHYGSGICKRCAVTATYTIHGRHHHYGWDHSIPPAETVAPRIRGSVQLPGLRLRSFHRRQHDCRCLTVDFTKVNPVTGPIYVDGARPGDAPEGGPSSTSSRAALAGRPIFRASGSSPISSPKPALTLWKYDPATLAPAAFGELGRVPLKPFAGTIGLAPAEPGLHSVVPPAAGMEAISTFAIWRRERPFTCPSRWRAPCSPSATTHAAQGDGEVCGTAIESADGCGREAGAGEGRQSQDAAFTTAGSRHTASRRRGL